MKSHQSGYTLVELSVAMALAGMVVVGGIVGATTLLRQQTINELAAQNADAIKRVTEAYAQLPSYAGLSLRQAVSFGAFSQFVITQRATDRVTVTHPLRGAVGLTPIGGGAQAWGLYLNAIPAELCADLLWQSAPVADAMVVFPGGMGNPNDWTNNLTVNANVPEIAITAGFSATPPRIVKNLTVDLAPTALANACQGTGDNVGVLLLKSKLR